MGFEFDGRYFVMNVLPFGAAFSPFVFQKLMNRVVAYLRSLGIRVCMYLDDLVGVSANAEQGAKDIAIVRKVFNWLGLLFNEAKSHLEPHPQLEWIGHLIDARQQVLRMAPAKLARAKELMGVVIHEWPRAWIKARSLASLGGLLNFLCHACPPIRVMTANLQAAIGRVTHLKQTWTAYEQMVPFDAQAHADLVWLNDNIQDWDGSSRKRRATIFEVFTDASSSGWGLHCPALGASYAGHWSAEEQALHISVKEAVAVKYALLALGEQLRCAQVQFFIDNQPVLFALIKGRSASAALNPVIRSIWQLLLAYEIDLLEP